ncbi:MAG TPA: retropepsin-like aspartic protease, partial [Candidatus Acidoferrales bacterium]|nr:retropepsin-like aspartic protease [Candidatus Acidoferrales bacterium]
GLDFFRMSFFMLVTAFAALCVCAAFGAAPQSLATAATPPLPSADTVFKRHMAAIGKLPTLLARWSGSITDSAQTARYEITAARDGRFRRTLMLALTREAEGSNGVFDWEQDENGNVNTAPAEHHSSMDARLVRLNDLRFDSATAVVVALTNLDGRSVYSVSLPFQGINAIVYFDARTWLVDGADYGPTTIRYGAYRRYEGVPVPIEVNEKSPEETVKITVDAVSFLRGAADRFDPPMQRKPQFPSGVHRIAFDFDSPHGLIVCRAKINGHPVKFLIDSGSTTSVIDLDLAKRLNLPQGGKSRVEGAMMFNGTVARIDSFDLNGIRFEPLYVQAVPLRLPERIAHEGIDGILGYDLFAPLVARISYRNDRVELTEPASFTYGGTGSVIPADTSKRVPIIGASIGKDHSGAFSVDTGSTASLVLFKRYAESNAVDFLNPMQHDIGFRHEFIYDPGDFGPSMASGAGGEFPTRHAVVNRLNLGAFSLPDLPTEIVLRDVGAFASKSTTDGIVGGGALALFAAIFIDYPNKRLIIEK